MQNRRRKSKNLKRENKSKGRLKKNPRGKRKQKKKPEWNTTIKDNNQYKLTEEEMARKKVGLVSKNRLAAQREWRAKQRRMMRSNSKKKKIRYQDDPSSDEEQVSDDEIIEERKRFNVKKTMKKRRKSKHSFRARDDYLKNQIFEAEANFRHVAKKNHKKKNSARKMKVKNNDYDRDFLNEIDKNLEDTKNFLQSVKSGKFFHQKYVLKDDKNDVKEVKNRKRKKSRKKKNSRRKYSRRKESSDDDDEMDDSSLKVIERVDNLNSEIKSLMEKYSSKNVKNKNRTKNKFFKEEKEEKLPYEFNPERIINMGLEDDDNEEPSSSEEEFHFENEKLKKMVNNKEGRKEKKIELKISQDNDNLHKDLVFMYKEVGLGSKERDFTQRKQEKLEIEMGMESIGHSTIKKRSIDEASLLDDDFLMNIYGSVKKTVDEEFSMLKSHFSTPGKQKNNFENSKNDEKILIQDSDMKEKINQFEDSSDEDEIKPRNLEIEPTRVREPMKATPHPIQPEDFTSPTQYSKPNIENKKVKNLKEPKHSSDMLNGGNQYENILDKDDEYLSNLRNIINSTRKDIESMDFALEDQNEDNNSEENQNVRFNNFIHNPPSRSNFKTEFIDFSKNSSVSKIQKIKNNATPVLFNKPKKRSIQVEKITRGYIGQVKPKVKKMNFIEEETLPEQEYARKPPSFLNTHSNNPKNFTNLDKYETESEEDSSEEMCLRRNLVPQT